MWQKKIRYLGTKAKKKNLNYFDVKIKRRMFSENACYHSVENLLNSLLVSKEAKTYIRKTTIP
jgi:hypothetical protein